MLHNNSHQLLIHIVANVECFTALSIELTRICCCLAVMTT